jgi:hypothetical protein
MDVTTRRSAVAAVSQQQGHPQDVTYSTAKMPTAGALSTSLRSAAYDGVVDSRQASPSPGMGHLFLAQPPPFSNRSLEQQQQVETPIGSDAAEGARMLHTAHQQRKIILHQLGILQSPGLPRSYEATASTGRSSLNTNSEFDTVTAFRVHSYQDNEHAGAFRESSASTERSLEELQQHRVVVNVIHPADSFPPVEGSASPGGQSQGQPQDSLNSRPEEELQRQQVSSIREPSGSATIGSASTPPGDEGVKKKGTASVSMDNNNNKATALNSSDKEAANSNPHSRPAQKDPEDAAKRLTHEERLLAVAKLVKKHEMDRESRKQLMKSQMQTLVASRRRRSLQRCFLFWHGKWFRRLVVLQREVRSVLVNNGSLTVVARKESRHKKSGDTTEQQEKGTAGEPDDPSAVTGNRRKKVKNAGDLTRGPQRADTALRSATQKREMSSKGRDVVFMEVVTDEGKQLVPGSAEGDEPDVRVSWHVQRSAPPPTTKKTRTLSPGETDKNKSRAQRKRRSSSSSSTSSTSSEDSIDRVVAKLSSETQERVLKLLGRRPPKHRTPASPFLAAQGPVFTPVPVASVPVESRLQQTSRVQSVVEDFVPAETWRENGTRDSAPASCDASASSPLKSSRGAGLDSVVTVCNVCERRGVWSSAGKCTHKSMSKGKSPQSRRHEMGHDQPAGDLLSWSRRREQANDDLRAVGPVGESVRKKEVALRRLLKQVLWQELPADREGGQWAKYGAAVKKSIECLESLRSGIPSEI